MGKEIAADGGQEEYLVLGTKERAEGKYPGEVRSSREDGEGGKRRKEAMEELNARIREEREEEKGRPQE